MRTLGVCATVLATGAWCGLSWGANAQSDLDKRIEAERRAAERRAAMASGDADAARKAAEREAQARAKEEKQKNLAEYKEKTLENLASVKDAFAKGEEAFKSQRFKDATQYYKSVTLATVTGSEDTVEKARGRLIEMEDLAKAKLKSADDADLQRDFAKEVEELGFICREFIDTKTREVAMRRLVTLQSQPKIAAHVEVARAEGLEAEGKLTEAYKLYKAVAENPRYEHSVALLKAKRKMEDLTSNEQTKNALKAEESAKAEREAPVLLNSAKNFAANNMPKKAIEKYQQVIDKFPGTPFAEQAQREMEILK